MNPEYVNCPRNIKPSKYEHNDPSARQWWYNVFDKLEKEYSIAPDERIDVIEELFPEIIKQLQKILNFQQIDPERIILEKLEAQEKAESTGSYRSRYGSNDSLITQYDEFDEETTVYDICIM